MHAMWAEFLHPPLVALYGEGDTEEEDATHILLALFVTTPPWSGLPKPLIVQVELHTFT